MRKDWATQATLFSVRVTNNQTGIFQKPSFKSLAPKEVAYTNFYVKVNHNARKSEPLLVILSFRNAVPAAQKGRVFLFYHKDRIGLKGAKSEAIRYEHLPGGTLAIKTALDQFATGNAKINSLKSAHSSALMWEYSSLAANNYDNIFLTMIPKVPYNKNEEFIKLTGVFIPENEHSEEFELEIEVIDAHDPNKIESEKRRLNFRKVMKREFGYTLHFQNEGDAPARTVIAEASIPKQLSKVREDIKVKSFHPSCTNCFSYEVVGDKVRFKFQDINLPGEKQKDIDKKNTKGYVKFAFIPKDKKIKKSVVKTRATIYFDEVPLKIKRPAKTWFKPGFSLGLKLGVNGIPDKDDYDLFAGVVWSPFKSYSPYYQPEVTVNYRKFVDKEFVGEPFFSINFTDIKIDTIYKAQGVVESSTKSTFLNLGIANFNYDINDWLSVGIGGQVSVEFREELCQRYDEILETDNPIDFPMGSILFDRVSPCFFIIDDNPTTNPNNINPFPVNSKKYYPSLYGDIRLGKVRTGPSIGARFLYKFRKEDNLKLTFADKSDLQLYVLVKF